MPRYRYDPAHRDANGMLIGINVADDYDPGRQAPRTSEGELYRTLCTQELVEVEPTTTIQRDDGATVMIGGRMEVRTVDLTSRKRRQRFMDERGYSDPSDWPKHLEKKQKERADIFNTNERVDHGSRHFKDIRENVGRALYELESRRRNRR